jgi:L-malate glycosyltransferase
VKIAICGPTQLHDLARLCGADVTGVPEGIGPTPLSPLISELLARGHQVTLYTLSHDLEKERFFDWGALRVFVGPSRSFGAARTLYRPEIAYLTRVIRSDAPSFVHAHWTYEFALGALGSRVPTIITIHDLPWNIFRYFRDRCRAVRLVLAYAVSVKGTQFTAVSRDAANHFRRYLRPGAPIKVIPNFVPDRIFAMSETSHSHPNKPLTFATVVQGWTRGKNATAALKAFSLFRSAVPESNLIMIGTDYEPGGLAHRWALSHNCHLGVTFVGRLPYEKMLSYMSERVDTVLIPSLGESFSMVALEAMTLGKPVIAGIRTTGVRDVLDYGKAGLLVDVLKPQAIADAMIRLQFEPLTFNRLGQLGHQRARSVYAATTVVTEYMAYYQALEASLCRDASQSLRKQVTL